MQAHAADGAALQREVPLQANGSGRLRQWSGKLGNQINTLKNKVGPNADQVTSTLRGLFQRPGSQDDHRYESDLGRSGMECHPPRSDSFPL